MNPVQLNTNHTATTVPVSDPELSTATIKLLAATFGVVPWMFQGMHQSQQ